jgi:DNA-binding NarL/FixJ family response regulator
MRVIVADDSAVIRQGVVRILSEAGMEVVAEARTADELLAVVEQHRPELAVVDIRMPPAGNAGLAAAQLIRQRYGGATAVLVLSQYLEPDYAMRLLGEGMGGVGYLLKDRVVESNELVEAAERVAGGGSAVDPAVVGELVRARRRGDRLSRLTPRERLVLGLLAEGRSNRSIADRLALSVKTVESSIADILSKLDLEPDPDQNRRVLAVLTYLDERDAERTG